MMFSFMPATKEDVKTIKSNERSLLKRLVEIEDALYEDGVIKQLEGLTKRIEDLEDGSVPETIKALSFNDIGLPWKLKTSYAEGRQSGYASILDKDGKTMAVQVLLDMAETIIIVINSYESN